MRRNTPQEFQPANGRSPLGTSGGRTLLGAVAFGVVASLGLAAPLVATADPAVLPVAVNDSFEVAQDHSINIYWDEVLANDVDALKTTALSAAQLAQVTNGTLVDHFSSVLPYFTYTPTTGSLMPDSFSYQVSDAEGNLSAPATITLSVVTSPVNHPPHARKDGYPVTTGVAQGFTTTAGILSNDTDWNNDPTLNNDPSSVLPVNVTKPGHGTLVMNSDNKGGFAYKSVAGYVGPDFFQYRSQDVAGALSALTTVSIDVRLPNPALTKVVITKLTGGQPGGTGSITVQTTSSNGYKAGAGLYMYFGNAPFKGGITDINGAATFTFPLGAIAGTFPIKVAWAQNQAVQASSSVLVAFRPAVSSIALGVPAGKPGQAVYLTARITSSNAYKANAPVTVYIDGKNVVTRNTDATGTVRVAVKLPAVAGKHSIKVVSGNKSAIKNFSYGTGVTAKLAKLKSVKAKKTQTIKGSFGYKSGKVTITVTDPKGKMTTKTVSLNSTGKFSYKYKTGKKGTYTVRYFYVANAKYYGAKSYKVTFKAK